jgi:CheY-like chemotaxis protein
MALQILLVSTDSLAQPIADMLRRDLDASVETAQTRREALTALRHEEFSLVLLEEALASLDLEGVDALYAAAGAAPVLEINFAICSAQRVLRQVKSALARRRQDEQLARAAAAVSLENELNSSLAGLLLESQLALRQADPVLAPKLRHLVELAGTLRDQLRH